MKRMINFPKIKQFSEIIQNVLRQATFVGLDENGDAIYDGLLPKPVIKCVGTIKLHGTNSAFCYNAINGLWYQSRESIITIEKDNAGYSFFCEARKDSLINIINDIHIDNNIDLNANTISVYGEFVGKSIQKNVAIANLDKSMFIFGVKVTPFNEEQVAYWVPSKGYSDKENRIYNIYDFPTYEFEIDFNNPKFAQDKMYQVVQEVEAECPVGKEFGFSGIGEGIVVRGEYKDTHFLFKCKGDKHAGVSKVKTIKPVDTEKLTKVAEIADKVTQVWRLDQMLTKACDLMNGGTIERKKLGEYIKLVIQDIIDEELHTIADAGLEIKDINSHVSRIAKDFFFEKEKEQVGL